MSENLAHIITYDIQQFQLDDVIVSGVQSVAYNYSAEISSIPTWGNPFAVKCLYKKPSLNITISKFISDNSPALGINKDLFPKPSGTKPSVRNAQILTRPTPLINPVETPLTQLKFNDLVITSIGYKFATEGFFTEEIAFAGHSLTSGVVPAGSFVRTETTGITKRRADFYASGVPIEVAQLISKGAALRAVELTIGFQYGEYPTYGQFYTAASKYVKYPYDITCSFELVDRAFTPLTDTYVMNSGKLNQLQAEDMSLSTIYKSMTGNSINIGVSGALSIDLGTGNYLQSSDRSGGDAGQGNYTVYKYIYKNNSSSFTIK
jgi:hypothetical protein